ncbi:aldehyde dehydrogenase (NADP(+)) [Niabella hirudinis]|uniref:aldehyde dehydrogenase (NADP(+)) n=1 Tax=Niabella hirudinis TaxID=1285929 RepID=UPI003EBA2108
MNQSKSLLDEHASRAKEACRFLRSTTVKDRAAFMHAVANKIEALGQELLDTAHAETALPFPRLTGEKTRTVGQWRTYADAVAKGLYTDARIDTADAAKAKNDIRKYNVGIGPVLVFGAGNFPFAFSTAGGDTASALGAGCPVIVKAHPAHPATSQLMANAIEAVVKEVGWPAGVFAHVAGDYLEGSNERTGTYLTAHPFIKAVGFTGSYGGGKALFDVANQRPEPIPVFAEMGSVNPVFAFSNALEQRAEVLAMEYAASLTLGVGQFCTNPGIFIAVKGVGLDRFKAALKNAIGSALPAAMLNEGIHAHFEKNKSLLSSQDGVAVLAEAATEASDGQGRPKVIEVSAQKFISNPLLSEEVFGPFGVVVTADHDGEVGMIAEQLRGQLTATLAATTEDLAAHNDIIACIEEKAGRLLFNGMPTGVEVVYGMQHGGPFPASTDARFTSVGPDAVKRFVRPLAFQNWPEQHLPDELKNNNSLNIFRMVNGKLTADNV